MILPSRLFQYRVDRLIAASRVVLALSSLAATWADRSQQYHFIRFTHLLLLAYTYWALLLLIVIWSQPAGWRKLGIAAHIIDLVIFTLLLYVTDGVTSPYFLVFVFVLLSASLKWRSRGAMWTTASILFLFIPAGFALYYLLLGGNLDFQQFMVRTSNLVIIGGILSFFGLESERIGREMLKLGSFPEEAEETPPVHRALEYAAGVFGVQRALLTWTDHEEPWLYIAELDSGKLREERVSPELYEPLIAGPIAGAGLLYQEEYGDVVYQNEAGRLVSWRGHAIHPAFAREYRIGNAVMVPLKTEALEGRLFLIGISFLSPETMAIAAAVAAQIGASIDRAAAATARRATDAAEQRLRLARDLHDGILQFLAGTAMQLEAIAQSQDGAPDNPSKRQIAALQDALVNEQRELRSFIRGLRPEAPIEALRDQPFASSLADLADRLSQQWGTHLALHVEPADAAVPPGLQHDIRQSVREAVANAVRHGKARRIDIDALVEPDRVVLSIEDNGWGLPLSGNFDAARLAELKLGPRSLRERTESLRGTFVVRSDTTGMTVRMSIPLPRARA